MVEVNVHPTPSMDGTTQAEVIVRNGKALDPVAPNKISIEGDIETVQNFLIKRLNGEGLQQVNNDRAIVIADLEAGTIQLQLDPENFYGAVITGTLKESPELEIFGINESREYSREDLIKLFRYNAIHFENPEKAHDLVKAFQKFSAKAFVELSKEDDTRGNISASVNKKVETGIPESFVLDLPIYKGQQKEKIEVNICLDVIGTRAAFWFESVQLAELLQQRKEEIFGRQLVKCLPFPIIFK